MNLTAPITIKGDAYCIKTKDAFSFEATVTEGEINPKNIAEFIYRLELDMASPKNLPRLKIVSFHIYK